MMCQILNESNMYYRSTRIFFSEIQGHSTLHIFVKGSVVLCVNAWKMGFF